MFLSVQQRFYSLQVDYIYQLDGLFDTLTELSLIWHPIRIECINDVTK